MGWKAASHIGRKCGEKRRRDLLRRAVSPPSHFRCSSFHFCAFTFANRRPTAPLSSPTHPLQVYTTGLQLQTSQFAEMRQFLCSPALFRYVVTDPFSLVALSYYLLRRVQESDGSFFESYTALCWKQENRRLQVLRDDDLPNASSSANHQDEAANLADQYISPKEVNAPHC